LDYLRDAAQGASNSAASTVSGPVDLINMGLLSMGLPMPANPFGGSQWMRERGLTRQPENFYAGLAGESVGNVLPIVAAAKAPQIAQGLLQAGDNLRAPTPMNSATRGQAGAIVYHGSPHKFDAFDSSKIGKGEGAQAYGHGLYFAGNPSVASSYRTAGRVMPAYQESAISALRDDVFGKTIPEKVASLRSVGNDMAADWLAKNADQARGMLGNLYKVDLPDEQIARMLDWDKPLSQQPEAVRKFFDPVVAPIKKSMSTQADPRWGDLASPQVYDPSGAELMQLLRQNRDKMDAATVLSGGTGGADGAARLQAAGVPGLRYLDGGSRTAGAGSSNFVVFPGNEGLLKILGRE
jgi:hypothetical protein